MSGFIDGVFGRVMCITAAATDSYAEAQINMPVPSLGEVRTSQVLVPLIKQIDLEWIGNLGGLSADSQLLAQVVNWENAAIAAALSGGISDTTCLADWRQANALTTSGEVVVQNNKEIVFPGDGILVVNPYLTVLQSNTATGVSLQLACRCWYEFVAVPQMSYLLALHAG